MRYGVLILPDERWPNAAERWQMAESMGFDHAWTYDHLTWRSLQDRTWFASLPTLAAASMVTETMRLGTLVASPNFRHPAPFAKELMTIDDICNGRLSLGFGAGADGFDATATRTDSWSASERQERFEEFVHALDLVLAHKKSNFTGKHYTINEARSIPGCLQKPRIPFALAATGKRGFRVVAKYAQTWVSVDGRGAGRGQIEQLEQTCRDEGREPSELSKLVLLGHTTTPLESVEEFLTLSELYQSYGFTDMVVHWPRSAEPFKADISVLEKIAAEALSKSCNSSGRGRPADRR